MDKLDKERHTNANRLITIVRPNSDSKSLIRIMIALVHLSLYAFRDDSLVRVN